MNEVAIQDTGAARTQAAGAARRVTNCVAPVGHGSFANTIKETLDSFIGNAAMVWRIGLLTAAGERPYYLGAGAAVWLLKKLSRNMAAALAYCAEGQRCLCGGLYWTNAFNTL